MPSIKEHEYLKVCAGLASCLSISIASARKKIDLAAARKGIKDISARKELAESLLKEASSNTLSGENAINRQLDSLLEALQEDENFMVED